MSASCEHRFPLFPPPCCRAHASNAPYVVGGTIALLAPRFVGAGAFSTLSFGSTSLILEFTCLIAILVFYQVSQRRQVPSKPKETSPNANLRLLEVASLLFLCTCAIFMLFESVAFAIAVNGGYDPSMPWFGSPAHHVEQALAASLLLAFCLLLVARSRHALSDGEAQPYRIQGLQAEAACWAALFLSGTCLAGLPRLSIYASFGSLFEPTIPCLLAVTACSIIACLASSLLWRGFSSSTAALRLSFFFCGSIMINLGQYGITSPSSQPFSLPVYLAAIASIVVILALSACLWSNPVGIHLSPDSESPGSDGVPQPDSRLFEAPFDRLSNRERQVLQLSAKGRTVHAIAQELRIAPTTVGTYKSRISRKLQLDWPDITKLSGIKAENIEPRACTSDSPCQTQPDATDHPFVNLATSLLVGLLFTLLLHTPQPLPMYAEPLCVAGILLLFTLAYLDKSTREPSYAGNLIGRYLLRASVSPLITCAIFHLPDGKVAPFSLGQHLLLFLLAWCVITVLIHFWSRNAFQGAEIQALDEHRMRSYLDSKGIQGMYSEVAVATLKGVPASEIARNLCISASTVTSYRARIYARLRVCGKEGLRQLLQSEIVLH